MTQNSTAIEIILPEQFEAVTTASSALPPSDDEDTPLPDEQEQPDTPEPVTPLVETVPEQPDAMITAQNFMSDKFLKHPRSRGTRQMLRQLLPGERIQQLCNIEAMAQVGDWNKIYLPDQVKAHATADVKVKVAERIIDVQGGAFRSKRLWYTMKYTCEVSEDFETVVAFSFSVGEAIPQSKWENLEIFDVDVHD